MRRTFINRIDLIISLISIAFFVWLSAVNPAIIEERIETLTLIYRFQIRNLIQKPPVPKNIVTVLVDEKSLSEFGRWPWPRGLQSELMTKILDQSPKVLAIDIMYPERDSTKNDALLAQALAPHKDKVVLATAFNIPLSEAGTAPETPEYVSDMAFQKVKDMKLGIPRVADNIIPPLPEIGKAAQLGHVYNKKDVDGKTVWELLYLKYNDDFYPSLALQAARIATDTKPDDVVLYMGRGIDVGGKFVPFDPREGKMLINYLGPQLTIPHVAASDVLHGRAAKDFFKDKVVFLGTSALATYDTINTPFSANMPGVEKNATVTENIIHARFITKTYLAVEICMIILTGILFGFIYSRLRALQASLFSLATFIGYLVIVQALFTYYGIWMNIFYPATNMLVIFTGATVTKYFIEERKAKEIRRMFSNYVTDQIIQEFIDHPEMAKIGGERRELTILFSDVRGFTSFSEKYSPEEVVAILNEYLSEMTDVIMRWRGTPDKFIGDAIMAFWGAPVRQDDHAELAVRCALDMVSRLSSLQEKWRAEGKPVLDCGIGINTGEVIVGNIGAEGKKMDYTIIGDHVNLCSRIEGLTRKYDVKILISEHTLAKIRTAVESGKIGHLHIGGIDNVAVKGKEQPVKIYELTSMNDNAQSYVTEVSTEQITRLKEK